MDGARVGIEIGDSITMVMSVRPWLSLRYLYLLFGRHKIFGLTLWIVCIANLRA